MEECHGNDHSNVNFDNSSFASCINSWRYDRMLARQHSYETTPQIVYAHPEMFDENGQLVPDEIVAVRFENNYDTDEEDNDD